MLARCGTRGRARARCRAGSIRCGCGLGKMKIRRLCPPGSRRVIAAGPSAAVGEGVAGVSSSDTAQPTRIANAAVSRVRHRCCGTYDPSALRTHHHRHHPGRSPSVCKRKYPPIGALSASVPVASMVAHNLLICVQFNLRLISRKSARIRLGHATDAVALRDQA